MNCVQPGFYEFGPVRNWEICGTQAIAVAAFSVDVKLGWHLRIFEREKIHRGVFDVDAVVLGLNDDRWRSFFRGMDFGVGRHVLFGDGEVSGVDDDGEVGAAANVIGGID